VGYAVQQGNSAVEAIIFIGLQGAGKSTFYRERFFTTHVRISLDLLKTRHREQKLLEVCLATQQPFVIDNTNPAQADREKYIVPAKQARFRVVGYYFQSRVEDCQRRNAQRGGNEQIPFMGLLGAAGRLQRPKRDEGFDELHYVRIAEDGSSVVEDWIDEV
jgi:predicted kinase